MSPPAGHPRNQAEAAAQSDAAGADKETCAESSRGEVGRCGCRSRRPGPGAGPARARGESRAGDPRCPTPPGPRSTPAVPCRSRSGQRPACRPFDQRGCSARSDAPSHGLRDGARRLASGGRAIAGGGTPGCRAATPPDLIPRMLHRRRRTRTRTRSGSRPHPREPAGRSMRTNQRRPPETIEWTCRQCSRSGRTRAATAARPRLENRGPRSERSAAPLRTGAAPLMSDRAERPA